MAKILKAYRLTQTAVEDCIPELKATIKLSKDEKMSDSLIVDKAIKEYHKNHVVKELYEKLTKK